MPHKEKLNNNSPRPTRGWAWKKHRLFRLSVLSAPGSPAPLLSSTGNVSNRALRSSLQKQTSTFPDGATMLYCILCFTTTFIPFSSVWVAWIQDLEKEIDTEIELNLSSSRVPLTFSKDISVKNWDSAMKPLKIRSSYCIFLDHSLNANCAEH